MTADITHGQDILAVWNDVDPDHETEYHRWYWTQHLPERLSVPGFLSAYRYRAVDAPQKFFTWYYVRNIEVLRSPAYLARLANPTEWTRRVMPWFRNMTRCACRLTFDRGRGIGANTVVLRIIDRTRDSEGEAVSGSLRAVIEKLYASVDESIINRAQMWQTDREISDQRTPEQALRGGADQVIDYALVLQCGSVGSASDVAARAREMIPNISAEKIDGPHVYTLMHSLSVVG